ncbi:MAG TPA: urea ABC transporter permease subunit UrtC [Chloroflexota bacterium]|nr:urea ABC transporter permease subunit UrtC [Chloroflexota bacterium]
MASAAGRSRLGAASRYLAVAVLLVVMITVVPGLLDSFRLNLLGKYLCYALVALGLDLAWGYAGLLSLGQSVFFGLGAYAFGMYLKLESAHGKLPDFMGWSGLTALPGYWRPFADPLFALLIALVLPAAFAAAFAYLLSRSRVGGVYFAIITQALAFIATTLFVGQQPFTGGTNGLTDFATIFGQPLKDPSVQVALYRATVIALAICCALGMWLARSRFGRLLVAMRDDEQRLRFSGYNPALLKAAVFGVAGGMAGLAGALYVPQVGIVNPDALGIILGINMVIWVAVGGRGTLWGAVLGALVVNGAQSAISEQFPDIWQYGIGLLFVLAVVYPGGLAGAVQSLQGKARRHTLAVAPPPSNLPEMEPRSVEVAQV